MRVLVVTLLMAVTITLGGAVSAGKKTPTNKEKIVGTWKLTKSNAFVFNFIGPIDFTFTTDGKFTIDTENLLEVVKGTYEVDGDTIKGTPKFVIGDPKHKGDTLPVKIKSISDKELVVEVVEKGKTETSLFARVLIPANAIEVADLDKKKLQGIWEYVGTETDGKLVKEKDRWGIVEFKGDKFITQVGNKKHESDFILNVTKKLKAIQFNEEKDSNIFAYELNGDRLRLCREGTGDFPKEFKTKGVMNTRIEEFKRVKK